MHDTLVAVRRVRLLTANLRRLGVPDAQRQAMRAVALYYDRVELDSGCSWEEWKTCVLRLWSTKPAVARRMY
jgi:hypothetical protein